ncbi:hypothetical protein MRX96_035679 [Rhipicephalus microplus]
MPKRWSVCVFAVSRARFRPACEEGGGNEKKASRVGEGRVGKPVDPRSKQAGRCRRRWRGFSDSPTAEIVLGVRRCSRRCPERAVLTLPAFFQEGAAGGVLHFVLLLSRDNQKTKKIKHGKQRGVA